MNVKMLLEILDDPEEGLEVIADGKPITEVRLNYVAGNLEIITQEPETATEEN